MSIAEPASLNERSPTFVAAAVATGVAIVVLVHYQWMFLNAIFWFVAAACAAFLAAAGAWLGLTHATVRLADANAYVEYPRNEFDRMRVVQCVVFGAQLGFGLFYSQTLMWMALNTAGLFFLWFEVYVRPTMRRGMV